MKKALLFISILLSCGLHAQIETSTDEFLPKGFAPGEEEMMRDYINSINSRSLNCINTAPDANSVRTLAEWEELQAVVISWKHYPTILTEIVRHAKEECEVIIICENDAIVKNTLGGAGVDWTTNVSFVEGDIFNSVWVRDYGPNSVYLNDVETLAFVDWIYNRPRPKDDVLAPEAVADFLGLDMYCTTSVPTDLVHTGGNFMADGLGTGFSSELILEENDATNQWGISNHSEEDIEQIMDDFMGITAYPKMTVLPYDAIHHIDMHMKLLDEERLLVGEYPQGVADGPQIEANIQFVLNNYTTPYGDPYEIVRIPMPPKNGNYPPTAHYRTYANAIFLNNTILVPTYEEQYDTTALRIWEESMPGYNVIGIDCNQIIPASGALHCITKEVGVSEPLWITHKKVKTACVEEETEVTAQIKHIEGIASAEVYYSIDKINWSSSSMTANGDGTFTAMLAPFAVDTKVYYYLQAEANDGKTITRPLPGAEGSWSFVVEECTVGTQHLEDFETKLETIFPNPAGAITCIPVNNEVAVEGKIEVTDILGGKIETVFEGTIPSGASKYFIDAANYASGTYFITLKTENNIQVQKLIVK